MNAMSEHSAEKDALLAAAEAIEVEAAQYDGISLTAASEAAGMRRAAWIVRERARDLPPEGTQDA